MVVLKKDQKQKDILKASALPQGSQDPFMYFANIVNGNIKMGQYDLSAPANNKIVMQILEAAKFSAKTGKTVIWKDLYKQ